MFLTMRRYLPAVLSFGLTATTLSAQAGAPIRDLPKPAREIDDPFSLIVASKEFRPGQLLVSDGVEGQVSLVDFTKGTKTNLGRKGAGPGEYTVAAAFFRVAGDTIWILDGAGAAARIVAFAPDLKPGATFALQLFNAQDTTIVQGSMFGDTRGRIYSTAMKLRTSASGVSVPDSMDLVWFDPRSASRGSTRTPFGKVRTPSTGKQDIQNQGGHLKVSTPFPGMVPADAWAVFPDGRVAIVRGANYRVEFILPDGSKPAPTNIEYERYKLSEADKQAEMDDVRKRIAQQMGMMKKMLPANITMDVSVTPPPSWPAEYPPLALLSVLPGPNGELWVRRATPVRLDHERWDVIDKAGKVVARWRLPSKTTVVAIGTGSLYTARTDEDDLHYVQRVELPR
jgi:hypothetical protein